MTPAQIERQEADEIARKQAINLLESLQAKLNAEFMHIVKNSDRVTAYNNVIRISADVTMTGISKRTTFNISSERIEGFSVRLGD